MMVGYDSPKPKRRLIAGAMDGYGGREPRHPGDCPSTISYGHDTHTRGCVEYTPLPPVPTCDECGHPSGAHAEVTNDGCFIDDCLCERRESETATGHYITDRSMDWLAQRKEGYRLGHLDGYEIGFAAGVEAANRRGW